MSNQQERIKRLKLKSIQIRKDICITTSKIGYSHVGGGMSMSDLTTALYYDTLNFDPKKPRDPDRDRFVLSKGHCGHVLYNIFVDLGMYEKEELWYRYNKVGGRFGMHPNYHYLEGIDVSTGSLGQGLSQALGIALSARMDKKNYRVFCMVGDGELQEGSNWEAIMSAAHYQMGNLIMIVDANKAQAVHWTHNIMNVEPLDKKLDAFGWDVCRIDGHDMGEIIETFDSLPPSDSQIRRKPIAIIADTVKGYSLPGIEGTPMCHIRPIPAEKLAEIITHLDSLTEQVEKGE